MVKVTDLKKTFWLGTKAIEVLKGADFEVQQGEMVAVVGKTADIEGVLITGVHGPGQVIILLVEDA